MTMARKAKLNVDYFPHDVDASNGKTIHHLEKRFGNDGYAVWFKILEKLGSYERHYIDCRNQVEFAFLADYCNVDEAKLDGILQVIADINAIDAALWSSRIIFCENFVARITDAYRRRLNSLPSRQAVINIINGVNPLESDDINDVVDGINDLSAVNPLEIDSKSAQREREREREMERERERERESKDYPSSSSSSCNAAPSDVPESEMMTVKEFNLFYHRCFQTLMPPLLNEEARKIVNTYTKERIEQAFTITAENRGERFEYFRKVLENGKNRKKALTEEERWAEFNRITGGEEI